MGSFARICDRVKKELPGMSLIHKLVPVSHIMLPEQWKVWPGMANIKIPNYSLCGQITDTDQIDQFQKIEKEEEEQITERMDSFFSTTEDLIDEYVSYRESIGDLSTVTVVTGDPNQRKILQFYFSIGEDLYSAQININTLDVRGPTKKTDLTYDQILGYEDDDRMIEVFEESDIAVIASQCPIPNYGPESLWPVAMEREVPTLFPRIFRVLENWDGELLIKKYQELRNHPVITLTGSLVLSFEE